MSSLKQLDSCPSNSWEVECKTDRSTGIADRLAQYPSPRFSSSSSRDIVEASPALTFTASPVMTPRSSVATEFFLKFGDINPNVCAPADSMIVPPLKASRFARSSLHERRLSSVPSTLTLDSEAQEDQQMGEMSAPETPTGAPETPRTPQTKAPPRSHSPPALVPKSKISLPPLLKALTAQSISGVLAALEQNPTTAKEPFWDHDVEPPLCCAVRLQCSADIVKVLLDHGADPEAKDVRGLGPLEVLEEPQQWGQVDPTTTFEPMWVHMVSDDFFTKLPPDLFATSAYFAGQESWRQEVYDLLVQATVEAF